MSPRPPARTRRRVREFLVATVGAAFALTAQLATAQGPQTARPLTFERLGQDRGLSNGTATAIVQDHAGFLWVGTEDGLNRYAGTGFRVFHRIERDSTSLADSWITSLLVGRDGTLWATTLHGGIQRFDPTTERFRRYQHADSDATSLASNRVNTLFEDTDGTLWAGTVKGLDRVDPRTGKARHYLVDADSLANGNDVFAIEQEPSGGLWVGSRTGVYLFDPRSGAFTLVRDAVPWFPVRAIQHDRKGMLWVATENALVAIDPGTRAVVAHYGPSSPTRPSPIDGRVLALEVAPDGALWIGSDGGLTRFDPVTRAWTRHRHDASDPRSIAGEIVRSVLVDRGGVLWVGLESYGLSKYAPSLVRFDMLRRDPASANTMSGGYARGITQDRAGNLWIATQDGGLNRRDARTGRFTSYRHREGDPRSLPGDYVWAVHEDRTGVLWVGTHYTGLGTLDPATGVFTRSSFVAPDANVNLITEDRAGRLLVGLEGRGMVEIDVDRKHARTYGAQVGDVRALVSNDVQTILEDRAGLLWVGGVDGLTHLDRSSGRATHYRGAPGRPGALGTDFVTAAFEDRTGTIWIATKGAGVARYDARTDHFKTLGVADGLPHAFVYGILEDGRGRLWLSTDDGLATYEPNTGAIARYALSDGLQVREFNRRAYYRSADGTMYFGGINGVATFRPDDVAPPPPPPPVAVLELRPVDGEPRHVTSIPADGRVTLPTDVGGFTITFAALDYTAPEKAQFAYRLDGVDRTWIAAGERREAAYASVRPGKYTFHVIASNAAGRWNRTGATLTIVVATPWWATWWARFLYALGAAGVVAGAIQVRLGVEHRRNARKIADITSAVPGAVFQLRIAPDGARSFPFVSEGVARLAQGIVAEPSDDAAVVAARLLDAVDPLEMPRVRASLDASRAALTPWHAELRCLTPDGSERWLVAHARPSREDDGSTTWTGVLTDGTPARRAEADRAALELRMLRAQKAESLAVLAGGIAHDFNNLLVGVLANADLLREDVPAGSDAAEAAGLIRDSAMRAAELTQQMLAYAGRGKLVVERVDLARLVPDMIALVRSAVPRTIDIEVCPSAEHIPVEADATQLRQIVMNLATNAAEAIGDRPGRVKVRVAIEDAAQRTLGLRHAAADMPAEGPYAVIEVADDGCGMDPATVDRIFDPFFSTKFTGRGLGLAALLGVVRGHHGGLRVDTAAGEGARFTLYFPLASATSDVASSSFTAPTTHVPITASTDAPVAPRTPRVLIVDDEPAILRTTSRLLRSFGYEPATADDGAEAVERLTNGESVDVVLMDMTMPRLDGLRAAAALRAHGITIPIILMSGYTEEEIADRGDGSGIDGFLKKPYAPAEVRAAIEGCLAEVS